MKRAWAHSLLQDCGVDPRVPWGRLLLSFLFVLPPEQRGVSLAQRFALLFPHIDFRRLRPGDLVRIPLQLLWLLLVRPKEERPMPAQWRARFAAHRHGVARLLKGRNRLATNAIGRLRAPLAADDTPLRRNWQTVVNHRAWDHFVVRYGAYTLSAMLAILCITTPFDTMAQLVFVALLWSIAMWIRRVPGPVATLLLIVLSVTASTRYLWWRVNYTLNWDQSLDLMWGLLLLGAELYTWVILLFGYAQTAWPLKRQPQPLPASIDQWPTVDVFIPTYDEPLAVVKPTVLAALGMDWPRDKLRIHLLDHLPDGVRRCGAWPNRLASVTSLATTTASPRQAT